MEKMMNSRKGISALSVALLAEELEE